MKAPKVQIPSQIPDLDLIHTHCSLTQLFIVIYMITDYGEHYELATVKIEDLQNLLKKNFANLYILSKIIIMAKRILKGRHISCTFATKAYLYIINVRLFVYTPVHV